MSYEYESSDIMNSFFKGKIKYQSPESKYEKVEIGHGIGIGHTDGSYSIYIKQLSENSKDGNGFIYLGKSIKEDNNTMSIQDETEKFETGDIPKLLITFHDLLNDMTIKVEWKNMDDDIILDQYYQIPSPQNMNYSWWDKYSTYFIGPEDLEEGSYKIEITSKELTKGKRLTELFSTINFSVVD